MSGEVDDEPGREKRIDVGQIELFRVDQESTYMARTHTTARTEKASS